MTAAGTTMVTFSVENRMFGLDRLAKQLNALVRTGQIGAWHPGRWTDWEHTAIEIGFDSADDAHRAVLARKGRHIA